MNDNNLTGIKPSKRRPEAGREKLFHLITVLFYHPEASLEEVGKHIDLSISTVKRMMGYLRKKCILEGRLGSLRLNLASLPNLPESFSTAFVTIESDAGKLKSLAKIDTSALYDSEEGLLNWVCKKLPCSDSYKGKILVGSGHVVMGSETFGMLITVHAISNKMLFDFVRLELEMAETVVRTQTLMVAYTVE
jgi:hypothetical protein